MVYTAELSLCMLKTNTCTANPAAKTSGYPTITINVSLLLISYQNYIGNIGAGLNFSHLFHSHTMICGNQIDG